MIRMIPVTKSEELKRTTIIIDGQLWSDYIEIVRPAAIRPY
jgi:hypothetical protein